VGQPSAMAFPHDVHSAPHVQSRAQQAVAALLAEQLDSGEQRGIAVAAFQHGVCIVDAWAAVPQDALFMAASVGKGVVATLLAVLHSRGELDYDAPLAAYAPQFRTLGGTTVAQAVGHRAGLCPSTPPLGVLLWLLAVHLARGWLAGWHAAVAWLAAPTPRWPPGTQAGYHHVSWSWIVGGLVQGAAGMHVRDALEAHVATPLRARCDMRLGVLSAHDRARVAPLQPPSLRSLVARGGGSLFSPRLLAGWLEGWLMTTVFNSRLFTSFCLPSSNGVWTARAVAAAYGALANGGIVTPPDGGPPVALLRVETLQRICAVATDSARRVPSPREGRGTQAADALGFSPWTTSALYVGDTPGALVLGHGGMGGSVAFADIGRGLSVAVLKCAYTPLSLSQTAGCAATRALVDCIRAHV